jgi:hypothetical protein
MRSGRSARTVGSPPVIFSDRTPSRTNTATTLVSSSNVRRSSLGSQVRPSAGMQYVHRKLQRSVTETRRSSATRPNASTSGASEEAGLGASVISIASNQGTV